MMLERERLAGFVGHDPAFEREFLALLNDTVSGCLSALRDPTAQIYQTLHAAKAGLSVAGTEVLRDSVDAACDLTSNLTGAASDPNVLEALRELESMLHQLREEIGVILATSDGQ